MGWRKHGCEWCGNMHEGCVCLGDDSGEGYFWAVAYRSLKDKSICGVHEEHLEPDEARVEVARLNRLYDGKVHHFAVPAGLEF